MADVFARMQHVVEFADIPLRAVDQRGMFGNYPLKVATNWSDLDAVRLLIEAGADVDAGNEDGYTALHWAATNDDHEMARLLLQSGASPNLRSDDGLTPIEIARSMGHAVMVELLS